MEFSDHPQFITITAYQWLPLLMFNKYKEIILDSLTFIVKEKRALVYGFVIMDNHFHMIWQIRDPYKKNQIYKGIF